MAKSDKENWKNRRYTPLFVTIGSLHAMFDGTDKKSLREIAQWGKAILSFKGKSKGADRFNVSKMKEVCSFICEFPESFMADQYASYNEARKEILGDV